MRFRFCNAGAAEGGYHMAVDRVLLRRIEAGLSEPLLRVYTWKPACLTLGYSQCLETELDVPALLSKGLTWARRPTGGRVVLHAREFTYSLLAPVHAAPWCASRDRSYAVIGAALQKLLEKVGLATALSRGESLSRSRSPGPSQPCFASTSRLEVTWRGRKLVGSAQRRGRDAFLQHGSLPLQDDYLDVVEVLPLDAAAKGAYRSEMQRHAVSLAEALNRETGLSTAAAPSFEDLADIACDAFAQTLGVNFETAGLTSDEVAAIESALAAPAVEVCPA